MIICNPFKRARYTFRTILSPEECGRRFLDTADDYNTSTRGRYILATAFGERFTAKIEPGSLGPRGSGNAMKHFVVEAVGVFRPARDGTVDVTIRFQRATSLGQLVWRLLLACFIALSVWTLAVSPIIPVFAVSFGVAIAPLLLLWSLVALAQGLRQAGKDWSALLQFIDSAYLTLIGLSGSDTKGSLLNKVSI